MYFFASIRLSSVPSLYYFSCQRAVGREGKVYSSNERNVTNSLLCNNIDKVVMEKSKANRSLKKVGCLCF